MAMLQCYQTDMPARTSITAALRANVPSWLFLPVRTRARSS
jgi:hypothetical protein